MVSNVTYLLSGRVGSPTAQMVGAPSLPARGSLESIGVKRRIS